MPPFIKETVVPPGNFIIHIIIYIFKTLEPPAIPTYTYHLVVTIGQPVNYDEVEEWIAGIPLGPRILEIHVTFI